MNKAELLSAIAEKAGITKEAAQTAFSATFEIIAETMAKLDKVAIPGFGNFQGKLRAERKGRNPSTGKDIIIPQAVVANFKAATQLKEKMNNQE
jgi:DNA-binding protein HU-beta